MRSHRLLLRSSEQQFFVDNFVTDYLPRPFHLSTVLDAPTNAPAEFHEANVLLRSQQGSSRGRGGVGGASGAQPPPGSTPLYNEAQWRMYCAGDVLASHLAQAMASGLNLQVRRQ